MAFDAAAAKAAGYSDDEIAEYLGQQQHAAQAAQYRGGNIAAPGSQYDPSAGGGQLDVWLPGGTLHTHLHTPQWLDRTLSGAGRGMEHLTNSVGDLFGHKPSSDALAEQKNLDKPLMATGAGQVGNLLGESALSAPLGMGVGGAVGKALPFMRGAIAQGALQGATQGIATADPGERGIQGALGGVAGGAVPILSKGAQALIRGLKRTPEAQRLLNAGVDLTPGQMNPQGVTNMFESAADSVPLGKQIVHPAREHAESQIQAQMIQHGAAPGTKIKASNNISDMLQQAYDSYAPLYDQAKGYPVTPHIWRTGSNVPLDKTFEAASKVPGVPKSIGSNENRWLQDRLTMLQRQPGGMQSDHLLDLRSEIRQRGREAALRSDANSAHIATVQKNADKAVTAALESQLPQQPLSALRTADSNYGQYKIIEDAVAKSKDQLHGLTPRKLSQAIYEATPDGAYARGAGGKLRQLAQDSASVIDPVIPPTGARNAVFAGGLLGGLAAPHIGVPVAAGMASMIGSKTGRAFAQGKLAPQRMAQVLADKFSGAVPQDARSAAGDLVASALSGTMRPHVPGAALGAGAFLTHRFRYPWDKKEEAPAEVTR